MNYAAKERIPNPLACSPCFTYTPYMSSRKRRAEANTGETVVSTILYIFALSYLLRFVWWSVITHLLVTVLVASLTTVLTLAYFGKRYRWDNALKSRWQRSRLVASGTIDTWIASDNYALLDAAAANPRTTATQLHDIALSVEQHTYWKTHQIAMRLLDHSNVKDSTLSFLASRVTAPTLLTRIMEHPHASEETRTFCALMLTAADLKSARAT